MQTEVKFFKELPESVQTQSELRRRIDKVLRKKEAHASRKAHEKFYLINFLSVLRRSAATQPKNSKAPSLNPRRAPRLRRILKLGGLGGKMLTTSSSSS